MTKPRSGWGAETRGMALGVLGVAMFSGTLPATRIAIADWNPVMIGYGRAIVAAALAILALAFMRQRRPRGLREWWLLIGTAAGVVFAFPLFSALAMQSVPASHGAVVIGIMPLATAVAGVVIAGDRPSPGFWAFAVLGSAAVAVFALWDGVGGLHRGDLWLVLAMLGGGAGYAFGGVLSRSLGGWQVICWALVVSLPMLVPLVAENLPRVRLDVGWQTWAAFAYVAVISQFLGFFAWNKGMALGGVARVGQTQLVQPFLTILFAALVLDEALTARTSIF